MTRQECETLIRQKMMEIADLYQEYHPDGNYLSMCLWAKDNVYYINNAYYDGETPDVEHPINYHCTMDMDGIKEDHLGEEA